VVTLDLRRGEVERAPEQVVPKHVMFQEDHFVGASVTAGEAMRGGDHYVDRPGHDNRLPFMDLVCNARHHAVSLGILYAAVAPSADWESPTPQMFLIRQRQARSFLGRFDGRIHRERFALLRLLALVQPCIR
jgi:hypothetical protein